MKRFDTSTFLMSASLLCSGCATPGSPPPANSGMMPVTETQRCTHLAVGEGTVWTAGYSEDLAKIDPHTGQVLARINIPRGRMHFEGIAVGAGAVWVAIQGLIDPPTIYKVSIKENRIVAKIAVGSSRIIGRVNPRIAFGEGAVWAAVEDTVYKIDPQTNRVVATTDLDLPCCRPEKYRPVDIAAGDGAIWVANHARIFHIDPRTHRVVATIPVAVPLTALFSTSHVLVVGAGSVWFFIPMRDGWYGLTGGSGQLTPLIYRIDPQTNQVSAPIPIGKEGDRGLITGTAAGEGSIWFNYLQNDSINLFRIDPTTNRAEPIIPLGASKPVGYIAQALAVGEGAVWACIHEYGVWRFPLRSR